MNINLLTILQGALYPMRLMPNRKAAWGAMQSRSFIYRTGLSDYFPFPSQVSSWLE